MRVVVFSHSLVSDWNHGNAHFLRGVATRARRRGHDVERLRAAPTAGAANLVCRARRGAARRVPPAFPASRAAATHLAALDLDGALDGADLVLVHEWNRSRAGARASARVARAERRLSAAVPRHPPPLGHGPEDMAALRLCADYDGVLAFGAVLRDLYLERGWADRAWTWHEAADMRVFRPRPDEPRDGDLVWIGNWGDGERTRELREFLLEPVAALGLRARVLRRALSGSGRVDAAGRGGHPLRRLAAELRGAGGLRRIPRDGARAAPALRGGAAGHPHDPAVRGAGLRHSAGLRALGATRGPVHAGRATTSSRATGPQMQRHLRDVSHDRGARRAAGAAAAGAPSSRATPAPIASTSCLRRSTPEPRRRRRRRDRSHESRPATSRSSARASSRRTGTARRPTIAASSAPCTRAATRHVLRARRLRPPAAPRHGRSRLGAGGRLPRRRRRARARHGRARRADRTWWSRRAASAYSTSCSSAPCWT